MQSTRRIFLLSGTTAVAMGGVAPLLAPNALAQAPEDLDRRVKAFLDQRRNTCSQGINYWNVRYEDGQALH